uniref:C2H2-type domain-containing protein n=1 Tax=Parastrongyloides trichosuri TaxID=131310 RepID=A0A0N4ZQA2_PARTI
MLRQLLARTTDNVMQEEQLLQQQQQQQSLIDNGFNQAGQVSSSNNSNNIHGGSSTSSYLIPIQSSAFTTNEYFSLKDKYSSSNNMMITNFNNILPNVHSPFIATNTGTQNYNYYNPTYNNYLRQDSIALNGGNNNISNNENGFYFDGNNGEICQGYLFGNDSNNNIGNINNNATINSSIRESEWNQQYNLGIQQIEKNQLFYGNNEGNFIPQNYYQTPNNSNNNRNSLDLSTIPKSIDDKCYGNSVTSISSINSVTSNYSKTNNINKGPRKPSRSIRSSQAAFSEAFKKMALLRHMTKCDKDSNNYYSIDDVDIGPVRCVACLGEYPSKRSLTGHIGRNEKCREIIGRNYLDQLSQNGSDNILISDYSNDGISPICPYCDRFISHYKGNIRRHINQCLNNDKKKRCKKNNKEDKDYDNVIESVMRNNIINNNSTYDERIISRSMECQSLSNHNHKQTPSFDDPFMCNLCSFLTVYKGNMKRHLMACHNYNDVIFRSGTIDLEQLHASRQGRSISPTLLTSLSKKGKKCLQSLDNNNEDKNQIEYNHDIKRKKFKKEYDNKKFIDGYTKKLSPDAEARIDISVKTVIENGLSYYSTI